MNKQKILKRLDTNIPETFQEMYKITRNQKNVSQYFFEISTYTSQNGQDQ